MIQIYDMTQRKNWDEIVRSFAEYDMYISVDMSKLSRFMAMKSPSCCLYLGNLFNFDR